MADIQFRIGNTELTNLIVQEQVRKEKLRLAALEKELEEKEAQADAKKQALSNAVIEEASKKTEGRIKKAHKALSDLGWLRKAKKIQVQFSYNYNAYAHFYGNAVPDVIQVYFILRDEKNLDLNFAFREVNITVPEDLKTLFEDLKALEEGVAQLHRETTQLRESINDTANKEKAVLAALTSEIISADPAVEQAVRKIMSLTTKNAALPVFEEAFDEA